jgi:Immunoglobulin domain
MNCVTGYSAPPALVHWVKDNIILTEDQGQQTSGIFGSSVIDGGAAQISSRLLLQSVAQNDAGVYWCIAVNTMTQQTVISNNATLIVNGKSLGDKLHILTCSSARKLD